ncbi:MAG: hypothetical protein ACLR6B_13940 [Blautia sp.]
MVYSAFSCLKISEAIFYKNIQEHLDKKSSLCYIYMESNFRTGLSDFYCFFYCMGEKWKIKADKYAGSNNFIKEGEQLENYTKYQLKSNEELSSLLEGKDNLYVIACNKCFKEFDAIDEPDCDEFLKFAAEQGQDSYRQHKGRLFVQ